MNQTVAKSESRIIEGIDQAVIRQPEPRTEQAGFWRGHTLRVRLVKEGQAVVAQAEWWRGGVFCGRHNRWGAREDVAIVGYTLR